MRRILCLSFVLLAAIAADCQTNHKNTGTINVTGTVTNSPTIRHKNPSTLTKNARIKNIVKPK